MNAAIVSNSAIIAAGILAGGLHQNQRSFREISVEPTAEEKVYPVKHMNTFEDPLAPVIKRYPLNLEYRISVDCGHKFSPHKLPRINCQTCWDSFFVDNMDLTREMHSVVTFLTEARAKLIISAKFGREKAYTNFKRFLVNHGEALFGQDQKAA